MLTCTAEVAAQGSADPLPGSNTASVTTTVALPLYLPNLERGAK